MQTKMAAMLHCKLLLLVCALSGATTTHHRINKHALRYHKDDWQPHFGYHKGHYAFEHEHRYKARSTTAKSTNGQIPLDDYVVRITFQGKLFCNGIIVDKQHVLTVSTCLIDATSMLVKLFDGSRYNVTSNSPATGFTTKDGEELLTLIKLGAELGDQYARPPPFCQHRIKSSEAVELWTWNHRETHLRKNRAAQVMDEKCKSQLSDPNGIVIKKYTSCVVNTQASTKCQRNFGLPYVLKNSFCGINILGHNCPKASSVDVYMRLLDEKRYISKKLNQVRLSGIDKEIF
ncbi:uncharacterized protein LOC111068606 [Drosophila obscura]|uniref:uncharacterized protein LOC111068606 n=1 Tax=Drosophila obscura TaxID=7282 RepID=UPI000BA11EDB|nr:uncharacterized protein LOC111068606 [Drosophila obscura]